MSISLEPVSRIAKDILKQIEKDALTHNQARFLVDLFYSMQEYRKSSENQVRSLGANSEEHQVLLWFGNQFSVLESQVEKALDYYSVSTQSGQWMRSIKGIGPVLAANFLAHLDVKRSPTAGGFWRFAGLDPTLVWEKGQKRPYNASLKVACWKLGDSWVKLKGHADSFYSGVYVERKAFEVTRNERGDLAAQAAVALAKLKDKKTPTYAINSAGKLSPAHLDMRARRYAVKLFLAHCHWVMHEEEFGTAPPRPYILEHGDSQHTHVIAPPLWPFE